MTIRLYLETNFLLCHAMGRDPGTSRLLEETWSGLQIVLPSCCVMEALVVREAERKRINRQTGSNLAQINELDRNQVSPHAGPLSKLLIAANQEWERSLTFFQNRFDQVIR